MSDEIIHSYKDLTVWNRSMELVESIYTLTNNFPKEEKFGLTAQMRRSAISIPSNIAEGRYRGSRKDFAHFLQIAFASGAELETQLEISARLKLGQEQRREDVDQLLSEVMKMLNVILRKVRSK